VLRLCDVCNELFDYDELDYVWDENGFGYSTKLVRCKKCGGWNVIEYVEDKGLDVNGDERFYRY
jgi:hypothetical protein